MWCRLLMLACARLLVSCTATDAPMATTAGDDALATGGDTASSGPLPLDLVWRRSFDSQSALRVLGSTLYESGWEGVVQYDLQTGTERGRFPGSRDTFRAWIGVDEPHDPVLIELGSFVLGRDREQRLARFDPSSVGPVWIAPTCGRLYAAALTHEGEEVTLYCAGPNDADGFGPGHLIRMDPTTGSELGARATFVATGPFDTHAVLEVGEVVTVRAGDHLLGFDRAMNVLFDRTLPDSFGLATTGHRRRARAAAPHGSEPGPRPYGEDDRADTIDLWVVASGVGLVQLDLATGADVRVIALPQLVASPDPFTSRLGELLVVDQTAYVESRGVLYAIDLEDGEVLFSTQARGAVLDVDSVYACSGSRFVELDRATGALRSSYSTGGCEVLGLEEGVVLVRYETPGLVIDGDEHGYAGVLAFSRRSGPPPACHQATLSGHVTVNGIAAPGITVRAGNAWATESNGVTHLWGSGTTPVDAPAMEAVTAADGGYRLTLCDRGHIPVIVDPEQVCAFAHEEEADGILGYVLLDTASDHVLDFTVHAHGPVY